MNIKVLLEKMIDMGASDLHIKPGIPPVVRVNGKLQRTNFPAPTPNEMEEVARKVLTPLQREKFESTREVDFAFGVTGLARFRANFYVQRSSIAMVHLAGSFHFPMNVGCWIPRPAHCRNVQCAKPRMSWRRVESFLRPHGFRYA